MKINHTPFDTRDTRGARGTFGFTLIELLVVITIITALGVSVFVALNPAQRLADARNARRTTDVDSILTAIHQYIVDNSGTGTSYPGGLTEDNVERQIGTAAVGCGGVATAGCNVLATTTACADLSTDLAPYLKSIPTDPNGGTAAETNYSVTVNTDGIVTVNACGAENTPPNVSASR